METNKTLIMLRHLIAALFLVPLIAFGQQIEVSGTVSAEDGPLLGVTVVELNTSNGTTTDENGYYSIVVETGATLEFAFLGYKKVQKVVNNEVLNVIMNEDASQLEEVVVKGFDNVVGQARRRAESVQSIPESVVTLPAEQIEATGVNNLQSFAGQVPNFQFNTAQNVGVNFITVRGIPQIRNGEAPIAFIVDGVTVPDANLLNQELFDLAMVEVVKGPQGALYGKNAIAGAINVLTQQPTNTFKGQVVAGYANGNTIKAQAAFSGPLVKDRLFFRASGSYKTSDGLFFNPTLGTEMDFYDDTSFRGQLQLRVSDNFKLTANAQYNNIEGGGFWYHTDLDGAAVVDPGNLTNVAPRADQIGDATLENFFTYLKAEIDLNKSYLQAVVSYNDAKRNGNGDLDHGPAPILLQNQDSNSEVINAEIRLGSKNDANSKFSWDLGGFYQRNEKLLFTDAEADFGFFAPPFEPTGTFNRLAVSDFTNTFNTIALFGFFDYKVSDKLTLSAGLRFDNDDISQEKRDANGDVIETPERTDSEIQPKFSASYQANDNMMFYGNYGRGYRVGGFNADLTVLFDAEYRAETSDNYEIGLKTSWWDNRFILNMAGYYTRLNDQQQYGLSLIPPAILIGNYNYNESEIRGFEADLKIRTSNFLDIMANYGVSKAKIIDGGQAGALDTNGDGTLDTPNDRSNLVNVNTPFVPQQSYGVALQSNFAISESLDFNAFVNYKGVGEIFWHEEIFDLNSGAPLPQLSSPGYQVLDARFSLEFNKKFNITIWGTNILDEFYAQELFSSQAVGGGGQDLIWPGNPAMYGVDVIYRF